MFFIVKEIYPVGAVDRFFKFGIGNAECGMTSVIWGSCLVDREKIGELFGKCAEKVKGEKAKKVKR